MSDGFLNSLALGFFGITKKIDLLRSSGILLLSYIFSYQFYNHIHPIYGMNTHVSSFMIRGEKCILHKNMEALIILQSEFTSALTKIKRNKDAGPDVILIETLTVLFRYNGLNIQCLQIGWSQGYFLQIILENNLLYIKL